MFTIKENESLAAHSTFRLGGVARFATTVDNLNDLQAALVWAKEKKVPWRVLGGGSNLLVSDNGFAGLIIWYADKNIIINSDGTVLVGAGATTALVAGQTVAAGWSDFAWGAGVPGTIGGAIYGNAGANGQETKDVIDEVSVWLDGKMVVFKNSDCQFAYRHSVFKTLNNFVILSARLKLNNFSRELAGQRLKDVLQYRVATQPKGLASSGCVFKNYEPTTEEIAGLAAHGVPPEFLAARRIPAGWLIEQSGLKGRRVNGAEVSVVHANFIVTDGAATATDIFALIAIIKEEVFEKFAVQLTEELTLL